jgi:CRISPR-associated protein Csm3
MRLEKIHKITGEISCVSNLHIGGSKDSIGIGTMDNPVIKHPITSDPYIPGSSLKGRMRCNMERQLGKYDSARGGVCTCGRCLVCTVFGSLRNTDAGPTRLIVRDALMTDESREQNRRFMDEEGKSIYGVKYETSIDRNTGRGFGGSLRPIEFVPSGTAFNLEINLQVYDKDNDKDMVDFVKVALKSLEETYVGGMGSRGYGQVKLLNLKMDDEPFELE